MTTPLVKLTGPNRRVWFLSEDGKNISSIKSNDRVYPLGGSSGESAIETKEDASITLTLTQNTVYECTNEAITDLTITGVDEDFICAVIIFVSPSTATTFAMPENGWYCVGDGCKDGVFTPKADMRYNLYVNKEFDRIAVYVAEAL